MTLLDDLSGFEFEETMALVFEKLGYRDVAVAQRVADVGRDIIMTDPDGERAVIVECKHTDTVGRPVIQKLDSAVRTYDHDGPRRGLIATTGRLTGPAREYAEAIDIEIVDGRRLRQLAEEVGMDLYNGRIEVLCERTLPPVHPDGPMAPIRDVIADVDNLSWADLPAPESSLTLVPVVAVGTHTRRTFETGAGIIHHVDERTSHVLDASPDTAQALDGSAASLVDAQLEDATDIRPNAYDDAFDTVSRRRFGRTETEYRDLAVRRAIDRHTMTVSYTGDNNVTYQQRCEPGRRDVSVESFEAVYLPRVYASVLLGEQAYAVDWVGAGRAFAVTEDTFRTCRVCADEDADTPLDLPAITGTLSRAVGGAEYTYCGNCDRIACQAHVRTERETGEPVCTACAETARFAGARRYFFDAANREAFATAYADRSVVGRVRENTVGAAFVVASLLIAVVAFLAILA